VSQPPVAVAQLFSVGQIEFMTQQDRHWWEQMREKGHASFVLREGILRYGVQVAFALLVMQVTYFIFFSRDPVPLIELALGWAIDAIIFGSLIGYVLWKRHEKDYHNDHHVA
jgi:hypothetical protein